VTTVGLFTPRSPDGRAEWRIELDEFLRVGRGGIVTFTKLGQVLNRDPDDERHAIYQAVARAAKELRATHSMSVGSVPGEGYRVLEAAEHEIQAYGFQNQATRKMNKAVAVLKATPLDDLTPAQRRRAMAATTVMTTMASALHMVAKQQRRQEAKLAEMDARVSRLEQEREGDEPVIIDAEVIPDEPPTESGDTT